MPGGPDESGQDPAGGEQTGAAGKGKSRNLLACHCECGRKIRVSPTTLAAGAITCTLCGSDFVAVAA